MTSLVTAAPSAPVGAVCTRRTYAAMLRLVAPASRVAPYPISTRTPAAPAAPAAASEAAARPATAAGQPPAAHAASTAAAASASAVSGSAPSGSRERGRAGSPRLSVRPCG